MHGLDFRIMPPSREITSW